MVLTLNSFEGHTKTVYSVSESGLWLKVEHDDVKMSVYCSGKHVYKSGRFTFVDHNGTVNRRQDMNYSPCWNLVGEMWNDGDKSDPLGVLDDCAFRERIIKHMFSCVLNGWGESVEEVVSWFKDLTALEWVVNGVYVVVNGSGVLEGLDGAEITVHQFDKTEDTAYCSAVIDGDSYDFKLEGIDEVIRLISETEPLK